LFYSPPPGGIEKQKRKKNRIRDGSGHEGGLGGPDKVGHLEGRKRLEKTLDRERRGVEIAADGLYFQEKGEGVPSQRKGVMTSGLGPNFQSRREKKQN